jgi:hypothetical protein
LKGCYRFVPVAELGVCSKEERLEAEDDGCSQTDRWVIEGGKEEDDEEFTLQL